jgi:hypothetical protein
MAPCLLSLPPFFHSSVELRREGAQGRKVGLAVGAVGGRHYGSSSGGGGQARLGRGAMAGAQDYMLGE